MFRILRLLSLGSYLIVQYLMCGYILAQPTQKAWWRNTTIYHIYPRSFYDSNGDGIGDIKGIIEKLDYIQQLGFETIWISPVYASPQRDFGYDISDYYSVDSTLGNMADCDQLIAAVHERGMKLLFDLVLNHTSDEHRWFIESSASIDAEKADWYVWRGGRGKKGKRPPNNWKSLIGGKSWHWNENRQQFYYASFLPFQPDLNYHNQKVKQAMLQMVRYWLAKGVDGFRLDIFHVLYEDDSYRSNPFSLHILPSEKHAAGFFQKMHYTMHQEKNFEFATELRMVVDSFPDRYLIGEVTGGIDVIKKYCEYKGRKGLHSVFLFSTLRTPFRANAYRKMVQEFEMHFPYPHMPVYVFSNHDRSRSYTRLGMHPARARLLAMFQFTVRGIPVTYYGEELGMPNVRLPFRQAKDALAHRYTRFHQWLARLLGETLNRDECRTPMLWSNSTHAGFTTSVSPWLPVHPSYTEINVATQLRNEQSLLQFYKKLLHIRNQYDQLQQGALRLATSYCNRRVLAYYREGNEETNDKFLVVLNMSSKKTGFTIEGAELLISTHEKSPESLLMPYEGRLYRLKQMVDIK